MTSGSPALAHVRGRVDRALQTFASQQSDVLLAAGEALRMGAESIAGLLAGGKRLRPAFCYWGWRGAGGPDCPEIINAAAALELLHAGALVHDDLMDASDTRRGQPSVHRQFEARHAARRWHGSAGVFGMGMAILLGDLLICWTDEMFHASGLPGEALRRVEFKTTKYTIERPLHLGAALASALPDPAAAGGTAGSGVESRDGGMAGAGASLAAAYTAYGLPLGVAFQLRDDILGVFGDPAQTGKPAGDDIREGKRTVLLAIARARATAGQAQVIDMYLGDPLLDEAGTEEIRAAITATGAVEECERMIGRHVGEAIAALDGAPMSGEAREALAELAVTATARDG